MATKDSTKKMYQAISNGDVDKVKVLLVEDKSLLEKCIAGNSWLHLAAQKNKVEVMKYLVKNGLDVNLPRSNNGETPLCIAAGNAADKAVMWLLQNGASINASANCSSSPIINAIYGGSLEIVKLIVEHGIDTKDPMKVEKKKMLDFAQRRGNEEIVKYLKSVDIDFPESTKYIADTLRVKENVKELIQKIFGYTEVIIERNDVDIIMACPSASQKYITLHTVGLSNFPASTVVPDEKISIEIYCHLPEACKNKLQGKAPEEFWMTNILRQICLEIQDGSLSLDKQFSIISNQEGCALHSDVDFTACLISRNRRVNDKEVIHNKKHIDFYMIFPLYPEEVKLEKKIGVVGLLNLFTEQGVGSVSAVGRKNVALSH